MFIGREQELKKLNRMYQSDKLEAAVIYGRRRVGKTTLINEFCKDKKTIFFAAQENSADQNLETLSHAVMEVSAGESAAYMVFRSFSDAFAKVAEMAKSERIILVIDEYPYLAQADRGISSLLQNYLDHQFKGTQLFLILCGSSMSFMENQVLGYQSPLYGRRTAQFKIQPFDYLDTGKWFPDYSYEDKAFMYGISGGIPMYLEQFSPKMTVEENLLENMFDKNAVLFEEPSNLLKQELREPAMYNAVVTAAASGKTKLSEIASTVGVETGLCTKYIANLITLGIIKRETPVTDPNSKRPIYLIEDQFFRFWYTFVPKNMSAILSGRMEGSYASRVGSRLPDYMGLVFEKMCRDYILYHDDELPFAIGDVGQWWGGNPKTRKQVQIDVVATSAEDDSGIVGSCKFRENPVSDSELELMEEYADAMGHFGQRFYYFFSKSGFAASMTKQGSSRELRLITLKDMYEKPAY
ncbi:MAG: ATP-binding protein [Lachnospiraceae bacterium]|nr:ATP-binding protein [Lachnospiraceae bacterium]